jgi:hypothetical protein
MTLDLDDLERKARAARGRTNLIFVSADVTLALIAELREARAEVTAYKNAIFPATTWSDETLDRAWRAAVTAERDIYRRAGSDSEAEAAGYAAMRYVLTGQETK